MNRLSIVGAAPHPAGRRNDLGWWIITTMALFGFLGAATGCVVGLFADAATAAAAALEVGLPSAILGALVGAVCFALHATAQRLRR